MWLQDKIESKFFLRISLYDTYGGDFLGTYGAFTLDIKSVLHENLGGIPVGT
jgi:hypothetical protein